MTTATQTRLSDSQLTDYERDGFLILNPEFDRPELDDLQSEFQRCWDEAIARGVKDNVDAKSMQMIRSRPFLANLHLASPTCASFLKHPVFTDLGRQLIGNDMECMYNQAVIKAPEQGKNSFAWHQDAYYALNGYQKHIYSKDLTDPRHHFTCWLAVTRTTVENGTLWVVPGGHRNGLLPHVRSPETNDWVCQFDSSAAKPVELNRGQMLLFCSLLPHQSGPNVSQEPRMAYQFTYSSPGIRNSPTDVYPIMKDNAVL